MKFHEDILNGLQVEERTRFCDGRTATAKTMSSHPEGAWGVCVWGGGQQLRLKGLIKLDSCSVVITSYSCFLIDKIVPMRNRL